MNAIYINLLLLPLIARTLTRPSLSLNFITAGLWLGSLTVTVCASRAAFGILLIGTALAIALLRKQTTLRQLMRTIVFMLSAVLTGLAVSHYALIHWFMVNSVSPRRLIMQASLNLLHHAPWYGTGLNTFALRYPAFRLMGDRSTGYFTHNDYLQILIELGYPGLVFFLLPFILVLTKTIQTLRQCANKKKKAQIIGLFVALASVQLHAWISYPFHLFPLLVIIGFFLGQLQHCFLVSPTSPVFFQNRRAGNRYTLLVLATSLLLSLQSLTLIASDHYYFAGKTALQQNDFVRASAAFNAASRWRPSAISETGRALTEIKAANALPTSMAKEKNTLLAHSRPILMHAVAINPWYPQSFYLLGSVDRIEGKIKEARLHFQKALTVNPLYAPAARAIQTISQHPQYPTLARKYRSQASAPSHQ